MYFKRIAFFSFLFFASIFLISKLGASPVQAGWYYNDCPGYHQDCMWNSCLYEEWNSCCSTTFVCDYVEPWGDCGYGHDECNGCSQCVAGTECFTLCNPGEWQCSADPVSCSWGNCSTSCGTGTQSGNCTNTCSSWTDSQSCSDYSGCSSCTPNWTCWDSGSCSTTCGTGSMPRSCSDGCGDTMASSRECTDYSGCSCNPSWSCSVSACSASCGGGTQIETCTDANGCYSPVYSSPLSCNTQSCSTSCTLDQCGILAGCDSYQNPDICGTAPGYQNCGSGTCSDGTNWTRYCTPNCSDPNRDCYNTPSCGSPVNCTTQGANFCPDGGCPPSSCTGDGKCGAGGNCYTDCTICATPQHLECQNNVCMMVSGAGTNKCTINEECQSASAPSAYHLECQGSSCVSVAGGGNSSCASNPDCGGVAPTASPVPSGSPAPSGSPVPSGSPAPGIPTGTISANPNPCTVTSGSLCSSTINWTTANVSSPIVCLKTGGPETLFANAVSGSKAAPWISPGTVYTFNLRNSLTCGSGTLLSSVSVTGIMAPSAPTIIDTQTGTNITNITSPTCVNSSTYSGSEVTISWTNPADPVEWVDISTSNSFPPVSGVWAHDYVLGSSSTTAPLNFTLNTDESPWLATSGTTYYVTLWNGSRSSASTFTVPRCPNPEKPSLSPPSCPDPTSTTFNWTPAIPNYAISYSIRVDANPTSWKTGGWSCPGNPNNLNAGDNCADGLTTTSYTAPSIANTIYGWRVRAVGPFGTSAWAIGSNFTCPTIIIGPWIQTTGDVHTQREINAPGGP